MLNIELHDSCQYDYLEMFNGGLVSSPSVGRFCGNSVPAAFTSQSNEVRIEFHSDLSNDAAYNGFRLQYVFITSGCGGAIHAQQGVITSPGRPGLYPANTECVWDITVQNGYHIETAFQAPFEMEIQQPCTNDYVELTDLRLPTTNVNRTRRHCGNVFPPSFRSSGNTLRVVFRSNNLLQFNGFELRFTAGIS